MQMITYEVEYSVKNRGMGVKYINVPVGEEYPLTSAVRAFWWDSSIKKMLEGYGRRSVQIETVRKSNQ